MANPRKRLPNRRRSETFEFDVQGQFGRGNMHYVATIGFKPDGTAGDIFLRAGKAGTDLDIATRELSIAVSMALQHGALIEDMQHAFPHHGVHPEGALGTLLKLLLEAKGSDAVEALLD